MEGGKNFSITGYVWLVGELKGKKVEGIEVGEIGNARLYLEKRIFLRCHCIFPYLLWSLPFGVFDVDASLEG